MRSLKLWLLLILLVGITVTGAPAGTLAKGGTVIDGSLHIWDDPTLGDGSVWVLGFPSWQKEVYFSGMKRRLRFVYGGHADWGLSDFFMDLQGDVALTAVPFRRWFGMSVGGSVGTFFATNVTYRGFASVFAQLPVFKPVNVFYPSRVGPSRRGRIHSFLRVGAGYEFRRSVELAGYMDSPNWYLDSSGFFINVSLEVQGLDK